MVKSRAAAPRRAKAQPTERLDEPQRVAEMIDFAARAKQIADTLGERFLAYLLAMVIQEMSQIEGRRSGTKLEQRSHPATEEGTP